MATVNQLTSNLIMEQTDKIIKNPLLKKTRAQLIEMIEELKTKKLGDESLKKEIAKLHEEATEAELLVKRLNQKNKELTRDNQSLIKKEEAYKEDAIKNIEEYDNCVSKKNIWKILCILSLACVILLSLYIVTH